MENFDNLFENQSSGFNNDQPFDKEAWAQRKQAERAKLYEAIDGMTDLTFSSAKTISDYLGMQSRLGKMSVANTLLVLAQKPDATYVMSFDDWHQRGRSVKRNEKALMVLEANGEYQREDGTTGTSFDAKRVFDVSQTQGKPIREREQTSIRSKLKALVTDTPNPVKVSDSISQEIGALYSDKDNTVYVARNMDDAYVYIDKELQRASLEAIKTLDQKDIIRTFPSVKKNPTTIVVLKTPKTQSSVRRVWLPKTVAYILREFREKQNTLKELLQDEYEDYNLVIPMNSGRPCEDRVITESFQRLRERVGLPNVVFHSLRHSSTTYKLKLNKGDLKATQGDTGHAEIDMITKVYAHILDEDRKLNAQRFEAAFYANPDLRDVKPPQENVLDIKTLIEQLQRSPELANALAELIK